jgi:hypothetical protein
MLRPVINHREVSMSHRSQYRIRRLLLAAALAAPMLAALPVREAGAQVATDAGPAAAAKGHHDGIHGRSSPLVEKVRSATARYLDVAVARAEGWVPATPCVSGPQAGAMGVHFVQPSRLNDGTLVASEPEALIYEPLPGGGLRLVGVEFIVFASDWEKLHPEGGTPVVDGHLTNYVGEPNRYGLHAFYELHVWAWQGNPVGSFADWNTQVSCDNQPAS